jgi:hypothetical protein
MASSIKERLQSLVVISCRLGAIVGLMLVSSPAHAYENMCDGDELVAGDEVTVNGETYTLEEDSDGLYIQYVMVDEDGNEEGPYTISVASFSDDCETVSFEENPEIDVVLVGEDVDEDE